jgi:preprotein translocase subunit Sec63
MTLEDAAATLGISPDATETEIQRAFTLGARASHPDRFTNSTPERAASAAEEFIRITAARDLLLREVKRAAASVGPAVFTFTTQVSSRRITWQELAAWLSVLVVAIFVSIFGANLPFTLAEPLVRFTVLTVGLVGFARTGRQLYFVLIVVCITVTAILTIAFTTFGALLGMLLLAVPTIGLVLAGRAQRANAARFRAASAPRIDEP